MVDYDDIQQQLAMVGYKVPIWQKAEVRELSNALAADEKIIQAINGHYEGGFGLLVATNHKLLLVDRKPMFLTLDAISYGMIQEISLNYRLLNSTLHIWTSNKCLDFSSWNHAKAREILDYAQRSIVSVHTGYQTSMIPAQPVVVQAAPSQQPVPQINYKGILTNSYVDSTVPQTQSSDASSPLAVSPADLLTSVKKTAAYRVSPLSGRTYSRRYF